jgi:UDP-glucose 4-epimerase
VEDGDPDARAFNIGTGVQTSVLDLVALLGRAAGVVPTVEHAPARAGELDRSALDATKAGHRLTWRPAVTLESGAKALIDWMRTEAR